jgi:AcrR family transcriptional regulator
LDEPYDQRRDGSTVSPRQYRLGARAGIVAQTRERIVRSARELFTADGFHTVSIDDVARRADVARATVYHQFGSKLGLLEAVLLDFESRAGLASLATLIEDTPPDRLLQVVVTEGCRYWATDPVLARKILAVAATNVKAGDLLAGHDAGRLSLIRRVVSRLQSAGLLSEPSPEPALNTLWVLTSFDAYDQLTHGLGLSQGDATGTLMHLAELSVLRRPSPATA